jgi:uncharacterized membrane protein
VPDQQSLFTHFVYPPLIPLVAIPMIFMADLTHADVELQYIYIAVLVMAVVFILRRVTDWSERSLVLLFTLGNPLLVLYAAAGLNDMLMFGLLISAAALLMNRQWVVSGVLLGLAMASKQTAWFYIPLWALLLRTWWQANTMEFRRGIRQHVVAMLATAAAIYLPFVINNPVAVFDDLVRFLSGSIPGSYPVGGSTIWQFAVLQNAQRYPFIAVPSQVAVLMMAVILFAFVVWRFRRRMTVPLWIILSTGILFGISIVNRFNYENYLSSLTFGIVAGWLLMRYEHPPSTTSP